MCPLKMKVYSFLVKDKKSLRNSGAHSKGNLDFSILERLT